MAGLHLDTVRAAVDGFWSSAQAVFWIRAAESSVAREDWGGATKRLLQLADIVDELPSASAARRELAATALSVAVRTDEPGTVKDAAARVLGRAWSAAELPDELVAAFRAAREARTERAGEALGVILAARFPHWPHGYYAAADFAERIARRSSSTSFDAEGASQRFLRAADLFEGSGSAAESSHCRLRAAAVLIDYTSRSDRGRELFRSLDAPSLTPRERLWLARTQALSPFWLDRVRGADFVGDVLDGIERMEPRFEAWEREEVLLVGRTLFERLPQTLQDIEVERLESLLERLDGGYRWELEAQLRGRASVTQVAEVPMDELDIPLARELEKDALPLQGFAALVAAWNGLPASQPPDDVSRAVCEVLLALARGDASLPDAVSDLARAVVRAEEGASLRPVALVLARLLETTFEDESLEAAAGEVALHFIRRAPTPSYGFWALASRLFACNLPQAGAASVERALAAGESRPLHADDSIARAVQWAARSGSDREMLEWLEVGRINLDRP